MPVPHSSRMGGDEGTLENGSVCSFSLIELYSKTMHTSVSLDLHYPINKQLLCISYLLCDKGRMGKGRETTRRKQQIFIWIWVSLGTMVDISHALTFNPLPFYTQGDGVSDGCAFKPKISLTPELTKNNFMDESDGNVSERNDHPRVPGRQEDPSSLSTSRPHSL